MHIHLFQFHSSCNPMFDSIFPLETSGAAFSFMNRSFGTSSTGTGAHMSKHHLGLNGINDIVQVNTESITCTQG
jgi:hypothetical protein